MYETGRFVLYVPSRHVDAIMCNVVEALETGAGELIDESPTRSTTHNWPMHHEYIHITTELCALVNKPSGASAGASDLKY